MHIVSALLYHRALQLGINQCKDMINSRDQYISIMGV
jgi:hypothetical protein